MVVNTNKNAVDAASSLQRSNSALSRSLSRLSSGSKIVNPSDDAAGVAISEKLSAQNSRIQAAQTNIQNAVSRMQTADGYLESMTGILDRMSELSVLAQDVTKVQSDIDNYNAEYEELKQQLRDVIGDGTEVALGSFNGTDLFGPGGDIEFIVGPNSEQTISLPEMNLRDSGALYDLIWGASSTGIDLVPSGGGNSTTEAISDAIEQMAGERSELGGVQSRLNVASAQLAVQSENLEAANSRIRDVDVAEETTRMAKYDLLVKSGTAMLTQANSLPQTVLRLLS